VWEFHELIPRLTDLARFGGDPADAFAVVAPSLPGFTLSFEPEQPRLGIVAMADLFARLMTEALPYSRFAAQGGDWGAYVVGRLAHAYGDRLLGVHLNFLPLPLDMPFPAELTEEDRAYQEEIRHWQSEETGYSLDPGHETADAGVCPDRFADGTCGLDRRKFHAWTDHDGDLERSADIDSLLTNITLSSVTGSPVRSTRRSGRTTRCGMHRGPFLSGPPAHPPPTRPSRARSAIRRARSPSRSSTSSAGRRCPAADTSPHSRLRSCSPRT
jgi:hypothetical protein